MDMGRRNNGVKRFAFDHFNLSKLRPVQQTTTRPPHTTDLTPRVSEPRNEAVYLDEPPTLPSETSETRPDDSPTLPNILPDVPILRPTYKRTPPLASAKLIRITAELPAAPHLSEKQLGKLPEPDFEVVHTESCGLGLGVFENIKGKGDSPQTIKGE